MDAAALASRVEQALSGKVLQKTRFGRAGAACFWIEAKEMLRIAQQLKEESDLLFDLVENLSVMQMEEALVLTYFLFSSAAGHRMILRTTLELGSMDAVVDSPSMAEIWESASPFETEAASLFGVRFAGGILL